MQGEARSIMTNSTRPYIVQAITTKYIGPTNTRGSRIKAKAFAGSITVHYDHALNIEENHANAAKALADKYEWRGTWFQGGLPEDCGYVFVSVSNGTIEQMHPPAFTTEGRH